MKSMKLCTMLFSKSNFHMVSKNNDKYFNRKAFTDQHIFQNSNLQHVYNLSKKTFKKRITSQIELENLVQALKNVTLSEVGLQQQATSNI